MLLHCHLFTGFAVVGAAVAHCKGEGLGEEAETRSEMI